MSEKQVTLPPNYTDNDNTDESISKRTEVISRLGSKTARRQPVVGMRYDPEHDVDDEEIEKFPKTDDELRRIKEQIEDIFIFKDLEEEDKNEFVDVMMPINVNEGRVIIRQDDDDDFFYVVNYGTFKVCVKNGKGEELTVKIYNNSGSFGELALLYNQPRTATVTATTNGHLWVISQKTFKRLVVKRAYIKRQNYMALLKKASALDSLTESEKLKVCDALKPVSLNKGETLFREGDEADGMYFVEDGMIEIMQSTSKNKMETEVAQLGPGEFFGEMALVKNQSRAETAKAIANTKLVFLEVESFERLLGPCINITKRRI